MKDERVIASYGYVEDVEKPIDYKYYFFLFKKNFYIVFTFFIICVTLAGMYVSKLPTQYQAITQVLIERPPAPWKEDSPSGPESAAGSWPLDYYSTQMEIMRSPAVLRQVEEELQLSNYFGVDNPDLAVVKIREMVFIQRVAESRLFNIFARFPEAQMAAKAANAVARAYIRKNFENALYYSKEILGWLPQKGREEEMVTIEDPFGGMRQISRHELVESLPSIRTDPTLRSLREKKSAQEAELAALLKQYREKHPLLVKARANLKFLEESIEAEKMRIIEGLKTQAEGRHQAGYARIIEEGKIPKAPLPVDRGRIIFLVGLGDLLVSFILIVLIDYFDDTIRTVEDFERRGLILPFLGPIPLVKKKNWEIDKENISGYYGKNPDIAEAFRYLRVAINFSGSPEALKILVFSSCLPHEGKSFTSHNIAISLALDGNRTLLIDADLRRPILHQTFQVENSSGLSNYLTSKVEFQSVIRESFVDNLFLVVSGPMSPNPGEILGSDRMKQFLEEARDSFDRIIIDCPPLTGIGDGYVVGSLIGQLILVVAAGKTPADLIKHTQKQLEKAHVKVMGSVLNMVDLEKERYSGYSKHYYSTYTRYYKQD